MKNRVNRAFTLVELMIVIAILGVIGALAIFMCSRLDSDFFKSCSDRHCDKGTPTQLDGGDCVCLERAQ